MISFPFNLLGRTLILEFPMIESPLLAMFVISSLIPINLVPPSNNNLPLKPNIEEGARARILTFSRNPSSPSHLYATLPQQPPKLKFPTLTYPP